MGCCKSKPVSPDTKKRLSLGAGIGSFTLTTEDKNFRSLVFQKRRLSDATLGKVLLDPVVSTAFKDFLNGQFGEHKLNFWLECDSYRSVQNIKEKQSAALDIFKRYIMNDENAEFLDSVTKDQIMSDLGIKSLEKPKVTTSDQVRLERVYLMAGVKVFQEIKFEYLPAFVTSDAFTTLNGEDGFFADSDDAMEKMDGIIKDMNMKFILDHPLAIHHFTRYIHENKLVGSDAVDLPNLWMEINHFNNAVDASFRCRRLTSICKRYKALKLPALQKVIADFDKSPASFRSPDKMLLLLVQDEIIDSLSSFKDGFKASSNFAELSSMMTTSSVADYSKGKMYNKKFESTLQQIKDFASVRNLMMDRQATSSELTLKDVLSHSQGLCHFKKFAIENFMEDSILYWTKCEKFKDEVEQLDANSVNFAESVRQLGEFIITVFIKEGSDMQVNVSSKMREETIQRYNNDATCTLEVFDIVQAEVLKLLDLNLWKKFKSSPKYKYLESKFKERTMIQQMQGRVGQSEGEFGTARRRSVAQM